MNPLLDAEEVAKILKCSVKTVDAERKRGRLPHVLVGKTLIRFTLGDVDEYLQGQRRVGQLWRY